MKNLQTFQHFRYNFERLCNKLKRVERLNDFEAPLDEAYFPKLNNVIASRVWPSRVENQKLQNVRREYEQLKVDIADLKRWSDRIFDAIHIGAVKGVTILKSEVTEVNL